MREREKHLTEQIESEREKCLKESVKSDPPFPSGHIGVAVSDSCSELTLVDTISLFELNIHVGDSFSLKDEEDILKEPLSGL